MSQSDVTKREIDDTDPGQVVNTIILWRIYDVLLLILTELSPESAGRVAQGHENGQFLGPNPSITAE